MSAFHPTGQSVVMTYTDDSTTTSLELASPAPTHLAVVNPDSANVIVINAGWDMGDSTVETEAAVPTSNQNGLGLVVGPNSTLFYALATTRPAESGNLFISVAGVSATGNVYITPGVYEPVVFKGY